MADMRNSWHYMRSLFDAEGVIQDFPFPFKRIWLDPVNGSDSYSGRTLGTAKKTLDGDKGAYNACTSGQNDTIVLVQNGKSTGTARVDAAFSWEKYATHLIGMCPPNSKSLRCRIAPTSTTTAFANFFTIKSSGCLFKNIQLWHGFATGVAASICLTLNDAHYNRFENCHIAGMGDAASAQSATSVALKLIGSDDNEFVNSTIGVDTIARTVANCLVQFVAGATGNGCARTRFEKCEFPAWTTTVQTQLDFSCPAANAIDRLVEVLGCRFTNANLATGYLIQTSIATAVAGQTGYFFFDNNCLFMGRTGFGPDATTRGFILSAVGAPAAGNTGKLVAPTT